MDNRLIPKWNTNLKKKRDNYISMREKTDSMNRQIAHYDEELKEARKRINDINELVSDLNKKDLINCIKEIIIKYCNSSHNYSDVNVKCLIEGREIEAEDIQMNNEARMLTISSMEDYV